MKFVLSNEGIPSVSGLSEAIKDHLPSLLEGILV